MQGLYTYPYQIGVVTTKIRGLFEDFWWNYQQKSSRFRVLGSFFPICLITIFIIITSVLKPVFTVTKPSTKTGFIVSDETSETIGFQTSVAVWIGFNIFYMHNYTLYKHRKKKNWLKTWCKGKNRWNRLSRQKTGLFPLKPFFFGFENRFQYTYVQKYIYVHIYMNNRFLKQWNRFWNRKNRFYLPWRWKNQFFRFLLNAILHIRIWYDSTCNNVLLYELIISNPLSTKHIPQKPIWTRFQKLCHFRDSKNRFQYWGDILVENINKNIIKQF